MEILNRSSKVEATFISQFQTTNQMWTLSLTHSTSLRAIFSLLSFSPRSPFFPSSRFSLLSSSPRPPLSMESHPSSSRPSKPFSTMGSATRGGGRGRGRGRGRGGGSRSNTDGESSRIDALGRLLTRILRHMASELNLNMRSDGYVRVNDLLNLNIQTFAKIPLKSHTVEEVREAVRRDNKQRFSLLEEDGQLFIRANQGHTIKAVESEHLLKPIMSAEEVPVCVHGTYKRNLESILKSGLKRMERLHVHFSSGVPTDGEVISGMRRDINILIYLDVKKALEDGMKLYVSDNKVILTEDFDGVVPVKYFAKIETWPGREPVPFQF